MRIASILTLAAVAVSSCCQALQAQTVLDRVERLLRQQVDAPQGSAAARPQAGEPGYLGLLADDRQDGGRGVRILSVTPDGPAAKAGLREGDLITSIGTQNVRGMDDMVRAVGQQAPGATLQFVVQRQGAESRHDVVLGRRPQSRAVENLPPPPVQADDGPKGPRLGIRTVEVNEEARRQNNLPDHSGAMIVSIAPGSGAQRAGLPIGAVITAVNGQKINSPQELAAAIRAAGKGEVELKYLVDGQETNSRVSLTVLADGAAGPSLQLRARPPMPTDAAPRAVDSAQGGSETSEERISALEARLRELEERLEKLEAAREAK